MRVTFKSLSVRDLEASKALNASRSDVCFVVPFFAKDHLAWQFIAAILLRTQLLLVVSFGVDMDNFRAVALALLLTLLVSCLV